MTIPNDPIADKELKATGKLNISTNVKSIGKQLSVQETWFFERMVDGFVFACNEIEAWEIMNNANLHKRSHYKMLGVSDGKLYAQALREASQLKTPEEKRQRLFDGEKEELEQAKKNGPRMPENMAAITPGAVGPAREKILREVNV